MTDSVPPAASLKGASMAVATLEPEIAELFRKYREHDRRHIFLEEISWHFIYTAGCTEDELDIICGKCIERGKELRMRTGGRRGRPCGSKNGRQEPAEDPPVSDLARFLAQGPEGPYELYESDRGQHGEFRDICASMAQPSENRLRFRQQIKLFIERADQRECAKIRGWITGRRETLRHKRRGRPDVFQDEETMARAGRAAWMLIVKRKGWNEIADAVGVKDNSLEKKATSVRRLVDYFAAAIWRTIPPSHPRFGPIIINDGTASEKIAAGALDWRPLQRLIKLKTGLPFDKHSKKQCKRIVKALWPRGSKTNTDLFERRFSYRKKKQSA